MENPVNITDSTPPASPIDQQVLEKLRERVGNDVFKRLITIFFTDVTNAITIFKQAVLEKKCETLLEESHKLKYGCKFMGAMTLSRIFTQIEELAQSGKIEGVENLLTEIENEWLQVKNTLETAYTTCISSTQ